MATRSAGLLLYRRDGGELRVLLVHMGGPYWAGKDERAWSIPKGECADGEDPAVTARREFTEELGVPAPDGTYRDLGEVRQAGGKTVRAWAVEGDLDPVGIVSNTFEIEWPPRSGRLASFPEVDRAEWFDLDTAGRKLVTAQAEFLDRLVQELRAG